MNRELDAVPDTPFAVKFSKTLPHTPSGVRSRKPLVGRGPRDQSSGQKPRARAPEVLPRSATLRFESARDGKWGAAELLRFLLDYGLKPILGGVLGE